MAQNQVERESGVERREREMLIARWEWHKFNQVFPDEDSCIKELYKRSHGDSKIVCRKCGSIKIRKIDERSFFCLTCYKKCWFTAGTPFVNFKKVKPWLFAQWLHKKGLRVSGSQLANLVMISKSSGAYIIRKIALLTERMTGDNDAAKLPMLPLSDNLIQFSEYKPIQEHLKVERRKVHQQKEPTQDQNQPVASVQSLVQTKQLTLNSEKESKLYAALTETPQGFDSLCAKLDFDVQSMSSTLTILELNGLATRLAGDRYTKTERPREKPRTTGSGSKKSIDSRKQKSLRAPTLVSLINSIKSALQDISKIIIHEIIQIAGTAIHKRKFDETPE
ncbi:MAG: hypothetical protein P4L53_24335 [Candidatus Obscuribacterales bacterium]|nr:hypothetical protein [Candidatus Obscuribacterales bacterium]